MDWMPCTEDTWVRIKIYLRFIAEPTVRLMCMKKTSLHYSLLRNIFNFLFDIKFWKEFSDVVSATHEIEKNEFLVCSMVANVRLNIVCRMYRVSPKRMTFVASKWPIRVTLPSNKSVYIVYALTEFHLAMMFFKVFCASLGNFQIA